MQRRLPEDDQWVVPHNLYLTVFSPASVNVMPFDPTRGSDHARAYATKYCSKPEKWYFLETVADALKNWLKARTVGICMAFNRLLSFHVVRSTRPCTYVPACFIGKKEYRNLRDPGHIEKYPQFPDPQHHALTLAGRSSLTCRMCLGPTLNEGAVLSELHAKVFFPPHIPSTPPCGAIQPLPLHGRRERQCHELYRGRHNERCGRGRPPVDIGITTNSWRQ